MSHFTLVPINELQAVNMLLAAIGESAVSSLETATTVDVTQAKNLLSNINREVQQKGWHFNTEWDVVLSLDSDSRIPLGISILSIYSPTKLTTIRGREGSPFLYDLDNNTFTWETSINDAITITLLDFEDIPQTARQYITSKAARIFQEEIIGQISAESINRQEEVEAYAGTLDMYNTTKLHRKLW